jgi:DNA-binding response OmpR family regulator
MRILIVEDDRKVASFVAQALREEGYSPHVASDGENGLLKAMVEAFDLVILDVMLPGQSGFEIVRELRAREETVPVLMLTARDAREDVVTGLDSGADDYLTKPFGLDELLARVRALLRRPRADRPERLSCGGIELDRVRHVATREGRRLDLTPMEFRLLEYLIQRPGAVVRRTELLEKVWDMSFDPMSNVVDVHVANLRQKLRAGGEPPLVHTVRGVGYVLKAEAVTP